MLVMAVTFCGIARAQQWQVPSEKLTYDIMYKWGVIHKKAGSVTISTTPGASNRFGARLTGATAPWADKFYKVRDTLRGTIDSRELMPYRYEKIAYEGGDFNHDELTFSRSGNTTTAKVIHRRKRKKDTEVSVTEKTLRAEGATLDMLTAFYYMRHIDYSKMSPGQTVKLNVFSGSQKEILTIHYVGVENVEVGKATHPAYHITFTFTSGSGKKTSDNMDAWLARTATRTPLLMEGKLPVGKVRAVLASQ